MVASDYISIVGKCKSSNDESTSQNKEECRLARDKLKSEAVKSKNGEELENNNIIINQRL